MFGIMHYFNNIEVEFIYRKYYNSLKNGILIIKNQFDLEKDIVINGFSEEQNANYYSCYRFIDSEIQLLKNIGYKNIKK